MSELGQKDHKSFFIETHRFCPRNLIYAGRLRDYFVKNHWEEEKPSSEDLDIIFGCEFSEEEKNYAILSSTRHEKNAKRVARVVVTGCLPSVRKSLFAGHDRIIAIGLEEMDKFDHLVNPEFPIETIPIPNIISKNLYKYTSYGSRLEALRYFLELVKNQRFDKLRDWTACRALYRAGTLHPDDFQRKYYLLLSNGCSGHCTYCSERLVFQEYKSREEDSIREDFRQGLQLGFRRFVLEAFDSGLYVIDSGTNLTSLLEGIWDDSGRERIEIEILNLNPRFFIWYFSDIIRFLRDGLNIAWVQVPIQSGSDRILGAMRRPYHIQPVIDHMKQLNQEFPDVKLETHFIVGCPGETGEDFKATVRVIDEVRLAKISVFRYERKEGTPAATMPDQIPDRIKRRRYRGMWRKAFWQQMTSPFRSVE